VEVAALQPRPQEPHTHIYKRSQPFGFRRR